MWMKWGLSVAVLLLGSCAQSVAPAGTGLQQASVRTGQCFRGEAFYNVNFKTDRIAYVATRRGHVYRLDSSGDCFDGALSLSLSQPRLSRQVVCTGQQTAVDVGQWRGGYGRQCVVMVSGPIHDSRESGLWSRQG